MPTVPGTWDFRILTYKEASGDGVIKTHMNTTEPTIENPTPLEQDIFSLTIPVLDFNDPVQCPSYAA